MYIWLAFTNEWKAFIHNILFNPKDLDKSDKRKYRQIIYAIYIFINIFNI